MAKQGRPGLAIWEHRRGSSVIYLCEAHEKELRPYGNSGAVMLWYQETRLIDKADRAEHKCGFCCPGKENESQESKA